MTDKEELPAGVEPRVPLRVGLCWPTVGPVGGRAVAGGTIAMSLLVGCCLACGRERAPAVAEPVGARGAIEEFAVPTRGASPWGIAVGRDAAIWFTEARGNRIGRIDPKRTNAVEEFSLSGTDNEPRAIAASPDGAIWFYESKTKKIARMESEAPHAVEEFLTPSSMTDVFGIAADAAGGVWFTETGRRRVARIAALPPHALTELRIKGYPMGIAAGPGEDLFFLMQSWSSVGHIRSRSPEELELFALSVPDGGLTKIVAGPGRDMWFLDAKRNTLGRFGVDSPHRVKEFEIPPSLGTLVDLTADPTGNLWLLSKGSNAVFRLDPAPPHALVEFPIPTPDASPQGITAGPDGNVWFTESRTDRVGRVVLSRTHRSRGGAPPARQMLVQALPEYIPDRPPPALEPLNVGTDLPCIVTVDGIEKGRLRRNSGDVFLVPPGRHVLVAVETDSKRSWTKLVDVWEGEGAVVEIRFLPRIEEEAKGFVPAPPGIAFVPISPGEFWMGRDGPLSQSRPRHTVRIARAFEIGKSLVTQAQWKRVMDRNPTPWDLEGDDRPVVNVSWDDTEEFLRRVNDMDPRYKYRLPTEAEWEYACRAGNDRDALERDEQVRLGPGLRTDSSPRRANAWGLYDLGGTTSEWCQDWYDQEYFRTSPREDPPGPRSGTKKVVKGGSLASNAEGLRPSERAAFLPTERSSMVGFRLVRVPR